MIDDAAAILRSRGIYRQAKLYRWGERIFAAKGAGYVRLNASGATSDPNVSWMDVEGGGVTIASGRSPKWTGGAA